MGVFNFLFAEVGVGNSPIKKMPGSFAREVVRLGID